MPSARGAAPSASARGVSSPMQAAMDERRRSASNTIVPMAARSPDPAKRCALPQSASAVAAGRCRVRISSRTSAAAAIRAPARIVYAPVMRMRMAKITHMATSAMAPTAIAMERARTSLLPVWI